jgi:hypothetical protein
VTFVDTEGASYRSSEGIYEWSAGNVGSDYFLGRSDAYPSDVFASIREGLRGEYRVEKELPPQLYLSPIDNRLHLLGAEGGLWNLGEGQVLREENLDGDLYLDAWVKEWVTASVAQGEALGAEPEEVVEALYALEDILIYAGRDRIELRQVAHSPSLLEVLPPSDAATWRSFRDRVEPLTSQKRDPADLAAWLAAFPGDGTEIRGATVSGVRAVEGGFRFVLELEPGFGAVGEVLPDLFDLTGGAYLVTYRSGFQVEPLIPPRLEILPVARLGDAVATEFAAQELILSVENRGLQDTGTITVTLLATSPSGESFYLPGETTSVPAGEVARLGFRWVPSEAGEWVFESRLVDARPPTTTAITGTYRLRVVGRERPGFWSSLGAFGNINPWLVAGLFGLALAVGLVLTVAVVRSLSTGAGTKG